MDKAKIKSPKSKTKSSSSDKTKAKKTASPRRTSKAGAGRPSRLSREMILEASLKLLEEYSTEGFTLARVAEKLDTVSMALYNYFPSREALLAELANHICKQFQMPERKEPQDWKQTLEDWLWTLHDLAGRYPVMMQITGVDGKVSAGWMRISGIAGKALRDAGFRGKELALNNWLFCCFSLSLVQAEVGGGFHSPFSLSRLDELEPEEQEFFMTIRPYHEKLSGEDVMKEGFSDLISSLARKLERSE